MRTPATAAAMSRPLGGTIVVENVFYLPGLGRLIFQSISNRDLQPNH